MLNNRQTATILAALRAWQRDIDRGVCDPSEDDIATDGGTLRPLDTDEIDYLCEEFDQ